MQPHNGVFTNTIIKGLSRAGIIPFAGRPFLCPFRDFIWIAKIFIDKELS